MDDARIARHAERHHGVFDQAFLSKIGVSSAAARRRVVASRWRQLHEGVFAMAGTPVSFELRATAALAAIPSSALGLRAAGDVHAFGLDDRHLDLIVPPGGRNRLPGVTIHQAPLPTRHVVNRHGFRVTSVERTLIDLGKVVGARSLQRCIEDQCIRGTTTYARVESMFGELAGRGRPGIARTRSALARLDAEPPTESELEAAFWRLLQRNRLQLPERQARFDWLAGGAGRVDFWYPDQRLIVELDGRRFHLRVRAFESDRRRDQLALVHGTRTVRFTHRQLATERPFVVSVMQSLLTPRWPTSGLNACDPPSEPEVRVTLHQLPGPGSGRHDDAAIRRPHAPA